MKPAEDPLDSATAGAALELLGADGDTARELDAEAEREMSGLVSLSALTTDLAEQYIERLARPIPSLTPGAGVQLVTRGYAARVAVERDPARFGATAAPTLLPLPPLRNGRPPQDLLTRAVKATRRKFAANRVVSEAAWNGFVVLLTARVHESERPRGRSDEDGDPGPIAIDVVDGIARFGWVLRMVDVRYGQEPERGR